MGGNMVKAKEKVALTVQEIVDIFTIHKNEKEMTYQINIYEEDMGDFWAELASEFEDFQNHKDDWNIYTGMVCAYHLELDQINLDKKAQWELDHEKKLLKFGEWLIAGKEECKMDKADIQQELYLFLEDEE